MALKRKPRGAATIREKNPSRHPIAADPASTVSSAELAGILREEPFTDRWLREMADRGYIVRAGRGRYDLAKSVQGYVRFVRETEVKAVQDAATSREAFEAERARKLKMQNDHQEALLMDTADGIAAVDAIAGVIRTELAAIGPSVTDDVMLRRQIEDHVDGILARLSERLDKAGAALAQGGDPLGADSTNHS